MIHEGIKALDFDLGVVVVQEIIIFAVKFSDLLKKGSFFFQNDLE